MGRGRRGDARRLRRSVARSVLRALDALAEAKEPTEQFLYSALCDLTNLDLRLVCYDLTSTYFEGSTRPSARFPSRAFGYSRDHRSDRPQVVIGLVCTGDGVPIAHHVFAGNTADISTLPGVLTDLAERFGVRQIPVVADRGLISAENVETLTTQGFSHILATRLHRDPTCAEALEAASGPDARWVPVPEAKSGACDLTLADGRRAVVVVSFERWERDTLRTAELVARTEAKLYALERRVRDGELVDPAKIGRAAQRILGASAVPACSTWRSAGGGSCSTTTRVPSPTRSCSPAATCWSPTSRPPRRRPPRW